MKFVPVKLIKKLPFSGLLFILCLALTGLAAAQNQYYVSNTGNDSNDGSQARPWATIGHAASALTLGGGGAVVNVAAGTYSCVTTSRGGSASQPIVFKSADQYGSKVTCGSGAVWFNSGNYVTIQGFEITGTGSNCYGITTHGAFNPILKNYVHDIPSPNSSCGSGVGGAGIETGGGGSNLANNTDDQVIGNIVANVGFGNGSCANQHGIYVSSPRNVVENNIVSGACGWGIQMYHVTTGNVISNNTVLNNLRGGILIVASDGGAGDSDSVLNNIVVNSGQGGGTAESGIEERFGTSGPNNVYRNNLLIRNSPTPFNFANGSRTTSGNLCDVGGTGCNSTVSATTANTFVNYTGNAKTGDYHLKAGSPAIAAGVTGACAPGGIAPCTPTADFDATPMTAMSIGAFQTPGSDAGNAPSAPTGLTAMVQ